MIRLTLSVLVGRGEDNLERLMDSLNLSVNKEFILQLIFDLNQRDSDFQFENKTDIKVEVYNFSGTHKQPEMRNVALNNCNTDYIWFIDDDVSIFPDTMQKAIDSLDIFEFNRNVGCIAGKIIEEINYDPESLPFQIGLHPYKGTIGYFGAQINDFSKSKYKFLKGGKDDFPIVEFVQGTSMLFRVSALNSIKGFNEQLGINYASYEDSEPCFALAKQGYMTVYSDRFPVVHHKMLRITGVGRTNKDIKYNLSVIRNHILSLMVNKYPTRVKSVLFSFMFANYHLLRMLSEKHKLKDKLSLLIKQPIVNIYLIAKFFNIKR